MARLGNYCDVISGYAFKAEDLKVEGAIPVIKIGNISNGQGIIVDENTQYVDSDFLSINNKYHIAKGDILISLTGSHINQPNSMVGRCCRNTDDSLYLLNQRAGKIIPKNNTVTVFIYYLFQLNAIKYSIANLAYGGANQVNVSPKDIQKIKWDIPCVDTQQKIASILSAYDSLIENNQKRIKLLERMAENLYKEWFVRFRFPGYETAEFEGGVPKGWKIEKLGNVASICTGKCNREDAEEDGIYPLFDRSQEIKKSNSWIMDCEAIIVPGEGTSFIPRYYEGKFNLHQRCYCIEPIHKGTGKFIFYMLMFNRAYFLSVATGATVPSLRQNNFTKMKFIMPPLGVCRLYDKHISLLFDEISSLSKQVEILTTQRDFLLPRLMSGKLEV